MMRPRLALLLVHLIGNALLLWLGYRWLGVDESDHSHLAVSAFAVILFIAGAAWLHGMALAFFSGVPLARAPMRSLRHLAPLFLLSVLALLTYAALLRMVASYGKPAFVIGSFLTMHLHRPVSPRTIETVFHVLVLVFEWVLVPAALLPVAASIAVRGWRGFRQQLRLRQSRWLYALEVAALLFFSVWAPLKLFFWIPKITSCNGQFASFLFRNGAGYLLFVFSLLVIEFLSASGKPLDTHPSTVASP